MVANDAAAKLGDPDPVARGEAALIVASAGDTHSETRLLQLAEDDHAAAARRATIALGLLATPAAIDYLETRLRTVDSRSGPDGVAAAFGLGLVPPDRVATSAARTLAMFQRGSWKRQHDVLLALLSAMSTHVERTERAALRLVLDDDANRAPQARALLLQLLLPMDTSFDRDDLRRRLRRGSDAERRAIVAFLADRPTADNAEWLDDLTEFARRDSDPHVRAAALRALARSRHVPALELAARALRSSTPGECEQAVVAMLAIGGASTRGALEQHILAERDPVRTGALLRGFQAPPTRLLLDHAARIATAHRQPFATRIAAAELIARSRDRRAVPILRDLFRAGKAPAQLVALARALHRLEEQPTPLDRLLDRPVHLASHPHHWQALLVAGHPGAERAVLELLRDRSAPPQDVRRALVAYRRAHVLAEPPTGAPASLATILRE